MRDLQDVKAVARRLHNEIDRADPAELGDVLAARSSPDLIWRGSHPFGELGGTEAVARAFWSPLKSAMTGLYRREEILFAGWNEMDGLASAWVVSTGHLMGLFDRPWLGIAPTGKIAMLRYCSFDRVDEGQVVETLMQFDIPHLMRQAGQSPFASQTAQFLVHPGPALGQGILQEPQPVAEGERTLAAINAMITDLGQWGLGMPLEEELARTWHPDMIWWGPEGIGSTFTIERYAKQHSRPFRAAFSDRSKTRHIARLAEGHFGGFFGWPNFTARLTGPYMGHAPTGQMGEFRVIDIYRREGDKLAENWVFIDLLHFWKTQGIDILAGEWP